MDSSVKNIKKIIVSAREIEDWILPLSFTCSSIANFLFFYLGLCLQENQFRSILFIMVCIAFAIVAGLSFLDLLFIRKHFTLRKLILPALYLMFFCLAFILSYIKFGFSDVLKKYIEQFIVFSVPALMSGILAASREKAEIFFINLEKLSVLVLPGVVFYTNSVVFQCNPYNWGRDFGIINYMSFAYTVMPFLLAHIVCFIQAISSPIKKGANRRTQTIRFAFIALYWFAILASGTRGTYICVIIFCAALFISQLLHHENVRRILMISVYIIGLFVFSVFIYRFPGLSQVGRMDIVVEGIANGKITTTNSESPEIADNIDVLVELTGGVQVANNSYGEYEQTISEDASINDGKHTSGVQDDSISVAYSLRDKKISDRGTLLKLSVREFLKSKLYGMYPAGFSIKYGEYPHIAVLELLCETGIIGTSIMLVLIIIAIQRMFIAGRNNQYARFILFFFMTYAVQANISGTIWICPALACALGYGYTVSVNGREN